MTAGGRKSLLVLASYLTRRHAGVAQSTINIINALRASDRMDVTVAAFEVEPGVLADGVRVVTLRQPQARRAVWRIGRAFVVRDYVRAIREAGVATPDAVYTQSMEFALASERVFPGVQAVTHFGHVVARRESLENVEMRQPWRTADAIIADAIERRCYRLPRATHVVSTPLVAEARATHFALPVHRFVVQPLGIDIARFSDRSRRDATREALGIAHTDVAIVCVARLVGWKRVDWLVRAVPELPGCHLVLVGDGEQRQALEAAVRTEDRGRVHFVGHRDPVPYLAAGDVFALPSAIESFGMVYAEAMAMRLPCVALRYEPPRHLSSARDVIGETGVLVSSERELRDALKALSGDPVRRVSLGERAEARARELFAAPRYAEFLERCYL